MPWAAPTDGTLRHTRQSSHTRYNRERAAKRGPDPRSTARWRRVRAQKLAHDPLCEVCLLTGRTTSATEVDHKIEMWARLDLTFTPENLQSLCTRCHATKSAEERQA